MKIAYICSDVDIQLLGHHGCSVHIREFTNALIETGHDVFIICHWLGEARDIQTKARVYHLQPSGYNKVLWDGLYDDPMIQNHFFDRDLSSILWNSWLQIDGAAILAEEKPDFIYERYALFGSGGLELARRFEVPLILELNAPLCDQQEGYQKFPLIETARNIEPQILCGADALVAMTQWLADWAVGLGVDRDKIRVLPDAVSEEHFGREPSGRAVREKYGLADLPVVGFVGSFHKWHDVAGLIDAFATLVAADKRRRLLLVGDGHDRQKLEKKVASLKLADKVVFTGKVPHEEVPDYLAAMDVTTVPYQPIDDFFFSPMKLFEGMAAGRPTVAADLGQIPDIVRHGETGWLYPAGDNQKLTEGLKTLLEDRDRDSNWHRGPASRAGSPHLETRHHRSSQDRQTVVCLMKEGKFFPIPERPGDVDSLRDRAQPLVAATHPNWLDEKDSGYYRYLGRYSADGSGDHQTASFLSEIEQLELAGIVVDHDPRDPRVRHLYVRAEEDYRRWSIGIFSGRSPLKLHPAMSNANPVLTRDDVTDVPAVFVADPFMIRVSDRWYMFMEVMNWVSNKGEIGLATSADGLHWDYEQLVLVEPFHLSYPHVFIHAGEYYMVPEARQCGSVCLYRATRFPTDWELHTRILEGSSLVDASPFYRDDRWWMLVGSNDPADTLRLYGSRSLDGTWIEHLASPLIVGNAQLARPAGRVVTVGSRTFRLAQNCSPEYGLDVRAVEINELSESSYRESPFDSNPILSGSGSGWNARGMHHLDAHCMEDGSWLACVDGWTKSVAPWRASDPTGMNAKMHGDKD